MPLKKKCGSACRKDNGCKAEAYSGCFGARVLTQADWFIDPINGKDNGNSGSAARPIQTFAEFNRRTCGRTLNPPGKIVTVTVLSDLPPTDPITFDFALATDANFILTGTATAGPTQTIATAVQQNRAANTAYGIVNGALAPGGWTPLLRKRLRMLDGASAGALAWVARDLNTPNFVSSPLPRTSRLTDWGIAFPDGFALAVQPADAPVNGNHYVVESLTEANWGLTSIRAAFNSNVSIQNLRFRNNVSNFELQGSAAVNGNFSGCSFVETVNTVGWHRQNAFFNCSFENGFIMTMGDVLLCLGGALQRINDGSGQSFQTSPGAYPFMPYFMFQGALDGSGTPVGGSDFNPAGQALLGPTAFFDCFSGIFANSLNAVFEIETITTLFGTTVDGFVPLWGNGNLLPIFMTSQCLIDINQSGAVALPSMENIVTGPGGNPVIFSYADDFPSGTDAYCFDSRPGGTNAYGPRIPFTWALLDVLFDGTIAGGFLTQNGDVTNRASNASNPGTGSRVTYNAEGV